MPRAVCVYCASSDRIDGSWFDLAEQVGRLIATGPGELVWGGGSVGLMGAVARAVHAHGGRVTGVIPASMVEMELAYEPADEMIVVDTMRQRKQAMEDRADGFLALPGGFGTLEELLEIITARRLGFHAKPVVLLNHAGFYDPLLACFDRLYAEHFADEPYRSTYAVADDPAAALELLTRMTDSHVDRINRIEMDQQDGGTLDSLSRKRA